MGSDTDIKARVLHDQYVHYAQKFVFGTREAGSASKDAKKETIHAFLLSISNVRRNSKGLSATVLELGVCIISVRCPSADGPAEEITVHDRSSLDSVVSAAKGTYKGMTIGRFANRICKGECELDGEELELATNNGPNHLHGGDDGFDQRRWEGEIVEKDGIKQVKFSLTSPDGDQGYPGELEATCRVWLNDMNHLGWTYEARTSKPTFVNLTNHTYWNLSGDGKEETVCGHTLKTGCEAFLEQDDTCIPIGETVGLRAHPLLGGCYQGQPRQESAAATDSIATAGGERADDRAMEAVGNSKVITESAGSASDAAGGGAPTDDLDGDGDDGDGEFGGGLMLSAELLTKIGDKSGGRNGLNHCFVRSDKPEVAARHVGGHPAFIATLGHPKSGRQMHVDTTEPGVQVYTGNWLEPVQWAGVCLETQHYPDSPNRPDFPSTVLMPGQVYSHTTVHKFEW